MFRALMATAISVLVCGVTGCDSGPHSAAGFRLPSSGDADRGRIAFVSHDCHGCHTVAGVDLPPPKVARSSVIALGGETPQQMTDGYLVTSVVNPTYVLAVSARQQPLTGDRPYMPDLADQLTVSELVDIVAFLQSRYSVQKAPRYPAAF